MHSEIRRVPGKWHTPNSGTEAPVLYTHPDLSLCLCIWLFVHILCNKSVMVSKLSLSSVKCSSKFNPRRGSGDAPVIAGQSEPRLTTWTWPLASEGVVVGKAVLWD